MWCDKDKELEKVVIEICSLPTGTLYLHRDQTHKGRCIFAHHKHIQKITELTQSEYTQLMADIYAVTCAITNALHPDKVNVLILGDTAAHMHIHICPKYKDGKDWGMQFAVNETEPKIVTDAELQKVANKIREEL